MDGFPSSGRFCPSNLLQELQLISLHIPILEKVLTWNLWCFTCLYCNYYFYYLVGYVLCLSSGHVWYCCASWSICSWYNDRINIWASCWHVRCKILQKAQHWRGNVSLLIAFVWIHGDKDIGCFVIIHMNWFYC